MISGKSLPVRKFKNGKIEKSEIGKEFIFVNFIFSQIFKSVVYNLMVCEGFGAPSR